ncbi:hypothetical protein AC579_4822 [Pseudocercospora musae]|uniref:CS domain-containing protein n=1 Tax=Pseudocercospora musae TaxID=113226 RepID=A0A139IIK8_9PEZI|nr:hypothetical protein AC579_4822 [Pseudocercospora musae]
MAAQAAERGKKALAASNPDLAIEEYTTAIKESPTSPDFYIQRSTAYLRTNQLEAALSDADQAVLNGIKRAKKEAVTEAQLARGKALYKLGRFADAQFVLQIVKRRDEKNKQVDLWMNKCLLDIKKLAEDDSKRTTSVTEIPEQPAATQSESSTSVSTSQTQTAPSATSQQTPADKIRHEWYQSPDRVFITLLAKGVSKDKVTCEFSDRSVSVNFPLEAHGSSFDFHLEPLFGTVNAEKSEMRVLPTKVEINLWKAQSGVKWSKLESDEPLPAAEKADTPVGEDTAMADAAVKEAVLNPSPAPKGPAYPTSSKSGPKNWDKIGEGEDEEIEGDEANHFFKKLYAGSSPEVQRAMMKSYQESNGTALSTNWEEVSKGRVETVPPDGMEAKPYAK